MSNEHKPYSGPVWTKDAKVLNWYQFGGTGWELIKVEDRGRVQHYLTADGRKARCTIVDGHPDWKPDPTPEQLRKESLERLAKRPVRMSY